MKLEYAFFADSAEIAGNGMFSVLGGGFDILKGAIAFPATRHSMSLIMKIALSEEESPKPIEFRVDILSPDGSIVPPEVRPVKPITTPRFPGQSAVTLCVVYQSISFPVPGTYRFRISFGDRVLGETTLELIGQEVVNAANS